MIPARFAPLVFGFLLSGMMSWLVSGLSTFQAVGAAAGFWRLWAGAWAVAWLFAFPAVLLVAPLARRAVQHLVGGDEGGAGGGPPR